MATDALPHGDSEAQVRDTTGDRSVSSVTRNPECSLTFQLQTGESIDALVDRVAEALKGITVLDALIFGSTRSVRRMREAGKRVFGRMEWPITWVDGESCEYQPIAGVQVAGFKGPVERIRRNGAIVGSVFEYGGARHCLVSGLGPVSLSSDRGGQTTQTLERLDDALVQVGFSISDVVRTWFFLDDILSWYPEFNRARTRIYSGIRFRTGSLPASTGVGARNADGTALSLRARAMQPLNGAATAVEVASPLQCPAPNYGSSFSRAMELSTATGRQLFVSGTASIAPGGQTLWADDIIEQIDQTMKVVEAILRSRGYRMEDITRAVAYFKHQAYLPVFKDWCATRRMQSMPMLAAHCDICRDDLGFEFEADAERAV